MKVKNMATQNEIQKMNLDDKRAFCNLNRACDAYWNYEKCMLHQKNGTCKKYP